MTGPQNVSPAASLRLAVPEKKFVSRPEAEVPAVSDSPATDVPPNSSPLRELAHAIDQALALPKAATERDELTYLRISRDRARLVREICREIIRDRDIELDRRDVMALVGRLRRDVPELDGAS